MTSPTGSERTPGGPAPPPGGPIRLTPTSRARLRPVEHVRLLGGFWAERQQLNHDLLLPSAEEQLEASGAFGNLRRLSGESDEPFKGPQFQDSDLYKWLEALGWELGRQTDSALVASADAAIRLVERAQGADGYLNSRYQTDPEGRFRDLLWSHELYCAGHLLQAGVAHARGRGDERLLAVGCRFADYLVATFGPEPERLHLFDGHPEIETALVELYRQTNRADYLELARYFVDARGTGRFGPAGGRQYYQDHEPVRTARTVVGHAVRQLYLATGAADLYLESGDADLLGALRSQWDDMVDTKSYLSGGLGARHEGEAFGEPYELPADRAYCETCAAIAAVHWAWRMLLVTGESRYADQLERILYNAFAVGFAPDRAAYAYVNPLHVRAVDGSQPRPARQGWFDCACCPPNVMRLLASLQFYLATSDGQGVQLHQYAPAELHVEGREFGDVVLRTETSYPWSPDVTIEVVAGGSAPWELALRLPAWCSGATATLNDEPVDAPAPHAVVRLRRSWQRDDRVVLRLPMPPRLRAAHPFVDAVRGCAAIERGPLVYCFEQEDQADQTSPDDLALLAGSELHERERPELFGGTVAITAAGVRTEQPDASLYRDAHASNPATDPVRLTAIPYHAWGNRSVGGMRVWLPLASDPEHS